MSLEVNRAPPSNPAPTRTSTTQAPSTWQARDFEAALSAASQRAAIDDTPARKGLEVRDEPTEAPPTRGPDAERQDRSGSDRDDGSHEPTQGLTGVQTAQPGQAGVVADPSALGLAGDVETVALAMQKAWLSAQAEAAKGLQVQFADQTFTLSGFGVTRLSDGTLSLQLASQQRLTPEQERALDTLRKRLEQRGVPVGEVVLQATDGDIRLPTTQVS